MALYANVAEQPRQTNYLLKAALSHAGSPADIGAREIFLRRGESPFGGLSSNHFLIFPVSAVVIGRQVWHGAAGGQFSVVGFDGFYGKSHDDRLSPVPVCYSVLQPGTAYAVSWDIVRTHDKVFGSIFFSRQANLIRHLATSLRCATCHTATQRVSGWLLSVCVRSPLKEIHVNHATLAGLLGFRREAITAAFSALRQVGSVSSFRSRVTVTDLELLKRIACDCYAIDPLTQRRIGF